MKELDIAISTISVQIKILWGSTILLFFTPALKQMNLEFLFIYLFSFLLFSFVILYQSYIK